MKDFPYEQITLHCKEEYPKEACGIVSVVKGKYRYNLCTNISDTPQDDFCISPSEYAAIEDAGEIITIVHSHPKRDSSPSLTDKASHSKNGTDWLIVGLSRGESVDFTWLRGERVVLPLYGRPYTWHVNDCGSFIRDFYNQEFGIELRDFHRPARFWEKGLEVYLNCYESAGFRSIEFQDLKYGDVILFAIGSSITTHGAVYIGDNKIAHHCNGRLSCKDVLGKYYLDRATRYLRHKDMENVENN